VRGFLIRPKELKDSSPATRSPIMIVSRSCKTFDPDTEPVSCQKIHSTRHPILRINNFAYAEDSLGTGRKLETDNWQLNT
jgi:hypothetical protein